MGPELDVTGLVKPQDAERLAALLHWFESARQNPARTPAPPELVHSRDVYLARTTGAIAGMTVEAGTGTDSSVGIVHKADCKLFRIDDKDPDIDVEPTGQTRPVYNTSTVALPAGTLFLAVKTSDGKFVAVQLGASTSATTRFIRFALSGALAATDASKTATVDDYWGGADPGATVTVYNLPASSGYVFSGASGNKGLATWDDRNSKWWIVQLQCP
jgi:hypothetical protein